jgi:hypothetical protein
MLRSMGFNPDVLRQAKTKMAQMSPEDLRRQTEQVQSPVTASQRSRSPVHSSKTFRRRS